MPTNSYKKGFTLIELMVVIGIIGIVFAIIITSANIVRKNSRDAKRQSDLRSIQSALEQYHADQTFYPASDLGGGYTNGQQDLVLSSTPSITSSVGNSLATLPSPVKIYQSIVPTDPSTGNPAYCYLAQPLNCSGASCQNYYLYTSLENPPSNGAGVGNYVSPGGHCISTYNFQITQP